MTLSRRLIAEHALAILDSEGPDALTVRRLADSLDVKAASLYHHVDSKGAILDAIGEVIGGGIDMSTLEHPDLFTGLRDFARAYRRAYLAHPAAVAAIAPRPMSSPGALAAYEALLRRIQVGGYADASALGLVAALDFLVLGSVLLPFEEGYPAVAELGDYPALAGALGSAHRSDLDEESFERALAALLDGWPPPTS